MIYAVSLVLIVLALLTVSLVRSFKLKTHKDFMVADRQLSVWVPNSPTSRAWRRCGCRPEAGPDCW
jgi:hypothetical protein